MFSSSHLYVAALLAEKRSAARAQRLVSKPSTPSLKARIDAAVQGVWSLLAGAADRPATPTLTNYPFRG